jgi:hypothetical protein
MHIDRSRARAHTHTHTIANNQRVDVSIRDDNDDEKNRSDHKGSKMLWLYNQNRCLNPVKRLTFLHPLFRRAYVQNMYIRIFPTYIIANHKNDNGGCVFKCIRTWMNVEKYEWMNTSMIVELYSIILKWHSSMLDRWHSCTCVHMNVIHSFSNNIHLI